MRHLLRMQSASILCAIAISAVGCSRDSQPASPEAGPTASRAFTRPAAPQLSASGARLQRPMGAIGVPIDHTPIWMRDSGTRYGLIEPLPRSSAPVDDAGPPPEVRRQPDWDLAKDDPARDYARRYAFFTKRYPDGLDCVEFGASTPVRDVRQVVVSTAAACPTGGPVGTVRDVFLVDVAGDHLTVDDKTKRNPLAKWPDGSDPEGPAAPDIREITDMRSWKTPLYDALIKQGLAPLRVQAYGRGTYPVVSIAGWHGAVQLNAAPDALQPLADAMCGANSNMPMGIVAGFDRAHLLRITCPSATRWEKF